MLIRDSIWKKIAREFSVQETLILQGCVIGRIMSPSGVILDLTSASPELREKLENIMTEAQLKGSLHTS